MAPETDNNAEREALIASLEGDKSIGHVVGSAEGFLVRLDRVQLNVATHAISQAIASRDEGSERPPIAS